MGIDLLSNSFTFDQEKSSKQYLESYFERKSLRSSLNRDAKAAFSETLHSNSSGLIQQSFAATRGRVSPVPVNGQKQKLRLISDFEPQFLMDHLREVYDKN